MFRDLKRVSLVLLAATVCSPWLSAQSFTASVRGVITDTTLAAVPGAKVVITDTARNTPFHAVSDSQGRYVATHLPPGTYRLTVEAAGFKKASQGEFPLAIQHAATIDVQLELGEITTTIEVESSTALLNTTIANLGQVVENKYIITLPNITRDPLTLTYLTAGVVRAGGRMGGMGGDTNTNFVANGARNSTSDVIIDGVSATNVEQNSAVTFLQYKPSVDAVQEFKIQTNFFSAEFGQTGSAIINMVSKSGTNQFHGTVYEFHRNSALNANSWFSNRAGRTLPDFTRNQFGGVVGGPIKRDKLFFFSTYEHTRQGSATTSQRTVPTELERVGDFSNTRTANGQLIQIFNPFSTVPDPSNPAEIQRLPFAENKVPKSMQNPVALNAMQFFPKANQPGAPFTNQNNWFEVGTIRAMANQMDEKID